MMIADPTEFGTGDFRFAWGDHICGIFDDHVQQMEVMGAFIALGLIAGQRCVWVGPPRSSDALRAQLASIGGDLPTLEASGQLLILPEIGFYLHNGLFDAERSLDLLYTLLQDNRRDGYTTMRFCGDLSYLETGVVDLDAWEAYESRLTLEVQGLPAVVVCQAARRQLTGEHVVAAFRTHRVVVLGDTIQENPFYAGAPADAGPSIEIV
jgi:hypothetical protein